MESQSFTVTLLTIDNKNNNNDYNKFRLVDGDTTYIDNSYT